MADLLDRLICRSYRYVCHFKPESESAYDIGHEFEKKLDNYLPKGVEVLSRAGEFRMGIDRGSDSGLRHETDKVMQVGQAVVVAEFKHSIVDPTIKNPFLIFWAKLMDYRISLLRCDYVYPMYALFVTKDRSITDSVRKFCYAWGIVLVEPNLRPLDVLLQGDSVRRMGGREK